MRIIKPEPWQLETRDHWLDVPRRFDHSDPGTGKTISQLLGWALMPSSRRGRLFVSAPLSILAASWGQDIEALFHGKFSYRIAHGSPKKRIAAFKSGADIVIGTHQCAAWLLEPENMHLLEGFKTGILDEHTIVKNRTAKVTKAHARLFAAFDNVSLLSGIPYTTTITDLFAPALVMDGGETFGTQFSQFQYQMCMPDARGHSGFGGPRWVDKPESLAVCVNLLGEKVIRHEADLLNLPENRVLEYAVELPPETRKVYEELRDEAKVILQDQETNEDHEVIGINQAVLSQKLIQVCTGATYDDDKNVVSIYKDRYDLAVQLAGQRSQAVIAINFHHERDYLIAACEKAGLSVTYIDGTVPQAKRGQIINDFQDGKTRVILLHYRAAAHGITLTSGRVTIWPSPTTTPEHYGQLNKRIHRKGQDKTTETIRIYAKDTIEVRRYQVLDGRIDKSQELLELLSGQSLKTLESKGLSRD